MQIKTLTEEEKKQKLEDLREKMAVKRAVKAKEEAKEARANEAIRRKGGQVHVPTTLAITSAYSLATCRI